MHRMSRRKSRKRMKKLSDKKEFQKWSYGFSASVLKVVFALWAFSILFGAVVIAYALLTTGQIEEPVNYMHEINSTFGTTVVGVLITRVVGNVFEHNNGSIFGTSIKEGDTNDSSDSNVSFDNFSSSDESNYRGD